MRQASDGLGQPERLASLDLRLAAAGVAHLAIAFPTRANTLIPLAESG
jgi:hypothetical protein